MTLAFGGGNAAGGSSTNTMSTAQQQQQQQQLLEEIERLRGVVAERDQQLERSQAALQAMQKRAIEYQLNLETTVRQCDDVQKRILRYQAVLSEVMQESASTMRREARREQHSLHFELGQAVVIQSATAGPRDMWCEGNLPRELRNKIKEVEERQRVVEAQRQEINKRIKALTRTTKKVATASAAAAAGDPSTPASVGSGVPGGASRLGNAPGAPSSSSPLSNLSPIAFLKEVPSQHGAPLGAVDDDHSNGPQTTVAAGGGSAVEVDCAMLELEEEVQVCKQELEALATIQESLRQQFSDYEAKRTSFLKELSRIREEDSSQFATVKTIGEGRYVLMHLLGKGGFSEVWKAFDLVEARVVACKVHHVSRDWSRQTKDHYLKHAKRELDIMRTLNHPRLTQLYDVFEHDEDTFVSVMEFSAGVDLDTYLKRNRTLRESDARVIMMQLVAALRHLAEQEKPIIHYDLKPANIIFHSNLASSLDIKITDFGLSKIITQSQGMSDDPSVELTSVGTGTFYYLPPECFNTTTKQLISNKVDIWAIGIIFYQMLYGKRPFGEGQSQKTIWNNNLIVTTARDGPVFPDKPKVSDEAKDVILRCLKYNASDRPDVVALSQDPYFRPLYKKRARGSGTVASAASSAVAGAVATGADGAMPPPVGSFFAGGV